MARKGAFAALESDSVIMGQIINISKGGLSFRYVADGLNMNDTFQVDIFLEDNGFHLKKAPFKPVFDFHLKNRVPYSTIVINQCGGEFGELTHTQMLQLDYFIGNYTLSEDR
jgi:hypothetical protein